MMSDFPNDHPVRDVEDLEEALRGLDEKNKLLHDRLVSLGRDYVNKIQGDFFGDHDVIYRLRNEILYRRDSFRFHLTLLLRTHNEAHEVLQSRFENPEEDQFPSDPMIMDRSARQQFAIFDSLLFHAISLFDYLAGLIQYLCGDEEDHEWNWENVRGAAFHPDNPFFDTVVAEVVRELHRTFVQSLYDHRVDVIHFEADLGGRTLTEQIGGSVEEGYDLRVFAPEGFTDHFDELKDLSESYDITLHYAGFWLSERTVNGAIEIVEALREYIDQKPSGSQR